MNRRKLRNILLEPRLQFRYAFQFLLFTAAAIAAIQVSSYLLIRSVVARVLAEAGPQSEVLAPVVDLAVRSELLRSGWMMPVVSIAALAFTARILHRFIGPAVPIRRHVERLAGGEYGGECRSRRTDEMRDVVVSLNELSKALERRHGAAATKQPRSAAEAERRPTNLRAAGFSLIELLVVLTVIMVVGMIVVAQFLTAYDRSRQRGTLADLRTLATANGTYSVDKGDYATSLLDLSPYYLGTLPPVDRWGYAWQYNSAARSYALSSRGSDGAAGPPPPAPWDNEPFECDLVVENGAFTQAPGPS